jgi:hypothetical protein
MRRKASAQPVHDAGPAKLIEGKAERKPTHTEEGVSADLTDVDRPAGPAPTPAAVSREGSAP